MSTGNVREVLEVAESVIAFVHEVVRAGNTINSELFVVVLPRIANTDDRCVAR